MCVEGGGGSTQSSPARAACGAPHLQAAAGISLDGQEEQLRLIFRLQLVPGCLQPQQQELQSVCLLQVQGSLQVVICHLCAVLQHSTAGSRNTRGDGGALRRIVGSRWAARLFRQRGVL